MGHSLSDKQIMQLIKPKNALYNLRRKFCDKPKFITILWLVIKC